MTFCGSLSSSAATVTCTADKTKKSPVKKIPFILFVNTREVGSFNYMSWSQIKELYKEDFVEIGNHSHSHEYLSLIHI